ncbi:hypothetical protein NPA31_013800 [Aurantimonas sp. MSK8Z-1]|uniref:hypothetical protein n=1 Tax=Mangrovibrevibacter kandeliae TaxID=2968473 RepID=UPI0021181235|nr:hypothetical protein [Aurantimonas sp. MSK8Z-1]MCW4116034.1 hypothetical protein [Aurantimonas sp. MSK8Z-1]
MSDPNADMIRAQQDKDVPETITPKTADATDSDPASEADRRAAGRDEAGDPGEQMDEVLKANRRSGTGSTSGAPMPGDTDPGASLARPDRSRLGD